MQNLVAAILPLLLVASLANADDTNVKIGVLSDPASLYAEATGPGSAPAVLLAAENSDLNAKGWIVEVISADHLDKSDFGSGTARKWFDEEKVDTIADAPTFSVALAVAPIVKHKIRL